MFDLRFCLFFRAFYSGFAAGGVVGSKHGTNTGHRKPNPFSATKPQWPGLVTEFSSISTRLATPNASAPPLLPSPVMRAMTGTVRRLIS